MKNIIKAGMLLMLLAVPVLIFLFLKTFGQNEFTLPVFYEQGVESSLTQCEFSSGQHVIPNFRLTSHRNDDVSEEYLEGKISVVEFFFTSCPNICPIMNKELSRVHQKFENDEQVQILSFSVDPEYDGVEVLSQYAAKYTDSSDQWIFLTGEKKDIYTLARCGFILPVEDGDGSPEDFIHSEKFILVDGKKRIRGYYDGTDREEVDRLIMEIEILTTERNN